MVRVIYVDDEPEAKQTQQIVELLTTNDMKCDLRDPPGDFKDIEDCFKDIGDWGGVVFLIDFNLAHAKTDEKPIGYRGNSLASELRNQKPDCPIILVSKSDRLNPFNLHLFESRSDLDLVLYKEKLVKNPEKARQDILVLHEGFRQLKEIHDQPWPQVVEKLGADADETARLREAFPPIDQERRWYIPTTIKWIHTVLMKYPGILYDSLHASARIGITRDSFLSKTVQEYFADAEYTLIVQT